MVKEGRNDHWYLEIARQKLEQKLNWGTVDQWSSEDFQTLSDAILASTDLSLSITTLKRLVGRVNYNATPHPSTLNAVARFLGFNNWRAFKQEFSAPPPAPEPPEQILKPTPTPTPNSKRRWLAFLLPGLLVLLFLIMAISGKKEGQAAPLPADIQKKVTFNTRAVADGIPNTVVFNYDLTDVPGKTFEIQQSWDQRKRFDINPKEKEATSTYYYPGYYRAKLVVDDQIIKEHDLFVPSNGWMAAIETGVIPRYILPEEWQQTPFLSVYDEVVEDIHGLDEIPYLAYYLVEDFGLLKSTGFRLQTRLRHTFQDGNTPCRYAFLIINCTHGFMRIPLSAAGCVGELKAYFNGLTFDGRKTDLSGLAHHEEGWQEIEMKMEEQLFTVKINQQEVLAGKLPADAGRIVGFRYKFEGAGELDQLMVWDHQNQMVVDEKFAK